MYVTYSVRRVASEWVRPSPSGRDEDVNIAPCAQIRNTKNKLGPKRIPSHSPALLPDDVPVLSSVPPPL